MNYSLTEHRSQRRLIAGVVVLLLAVGWGSYTAFNRQTDPVAEAELEDDVAFIESAGAETETEEPDHPPRRLATATFTDVVTAGHHESDDQQSTVLQVGFERPGPASKSAVWLDGTIEDGTIKGGTMEPAPWLLRGADAPASRGVGRQFSTK
jgi:hypothetical protein